MNSIPAETSTMAFMGRVMSDRDMNGHLWSAERKDCYSVTEQKTNEKYLERCTQTYNHIMKVCVFM